ncbi:hypothetical protein LTS18_006739 [Coniosporium uncinatum]|uniref:Uncharacterized protein n=1 Tax=Coniosporium uncinatum TaxID=93489 RepID=A0ACC3DCJ1_9PEZI|nr:hypothetical protein LTS18_006739 [Coniosporium uncinatum]
MAKDFVAWSKRRDSEIHRLGRPSDNDGGVSCNRYGYAPKRLQKAVVDVRRRYNEVLDPTVELSSPPIGNLSAAVEGSGLNIAVNERFRDSGFVNCKDDRVLNSFLPEIVAAGARERFFTYDTFTLNDLDGIFGFENEMPISVSRRQPAPHRSAHQDLRRNTIAQHHRRGP